MTASAAPTPAPAPAPVPTPVPTPVSTAFDWSSIGLQPDHLAHAQAKGWKSPADAVAAHRAAEGLIGVPAENVIKLPKEDTPEAWAPVWDRLGRPKTPDEYKLPVPEGEDAGFAKTASQWFHKRGIPAKQAQELTADWNQYQADQRALALAKQQETDAVQRTSLRQEWGAEFDSRKAVAEGAAVKFGMTEQQLSALQQAMGPREALKFLNNIGSKLGVEPGFVQGNREPGFGSLSADDAKGKIAAAMKDLGWQQKFRQGDAEAARQWRDWHQIAYSHANVTPENIRSVTRAQ